MVFCFVQNFFSGQHESQNIYFFCHSKRNFFFQNSTLGHMTKTLNQIIIFFLHQNQNIFSATLGIRIFFQKKNITPPLQVKWSFPKKCLDLCTNMSLEQVVEFTTGIIQIFLDRQTIAGKQRETIVCICQITIYIYN